MQEKWTKWEPISNLAKKYYVKFISEDTKDKYKILLSDTENNKNKILISWPLGVDAHRSTDESYTLATINFLDKQYGTEFYGDWTFFKIENSSYLRWLSEQSYGISEEYNLTHFCILAADSMIDVINNYEPTITILNGKDEA